ncbi:hypothetical protein E4Y15_16665 [Salmonella enterica]|nr:hypothetical protein [Salmonella enterica]EBG4562148.1 hypothetical protein [Salmonella enterica]EGW1229102.1 hypothetical protein [Salmonella enterica]EIP1801362.1 hypothetical protein [Salmonella enterica]EKK6522302.1 hypothetical protein [Salmonella enterica]
MSNSYQVNNVTFETDLNDINGEISALKMALALSIFSQSHEHALRVMKSLKEMDNPHMQKLYKELMQFSPVNATANK